MKYALVKSSAMLTVSSDASAAIPLDQIWSLRMPGTKDVLQLDPNIVHNQLNNLLGNSQQSISSPPISEEITTALFVKRDLGKENAPCFAVVGDGLRTLRQAHAVLADGQPPLKRLSSDERVSLVFFSYRFGAYVHIHKVERKDKLVEIHFRFVPHIYRDFKSHLAIIPLGTLPIGQYQVKIIQSEIEKQPGWPEWPYKDVEPEWERQCICQPFTFEVLAKTAKHNLKRKGSKKSLILCASLPFDTLLAKPNLF